MMNTLRKLLPMADMPESPAIGVILDITEPKKRPKITMNPQQIKPMIDKKAAPSGSFA